MSTTTPAKLTGPVFAPAWMKWPEPLPTTGTVLRSACKQIKAVVVANKPGHVLVKF